MSTLTVTAKGQITLRKGLLRHLGIVPGDRLAVAALPGGRLEVSAAKQTGSISDLHGVLGSKTTTSLTVDEMNAVAADGWAGNA